MSINQRLKDVLFFYKKNATDFSEYLNVSRNTVARVINEDKLPGIKLLMPLTEIGIDINWLLTGEGEMLRKKSSSREGNQIINKDGTIMGVGNNNNIENNSIKENSYLKEIEYLKKENESLKSQLESKDQIIESKDTIISLLQNKS